MLDGVAGTLLAHVIFGLLLQASQAIRTGSEQWIAEPVAASDSSSDGRFRPGAVQGWSGATSPRPTGPRSRLMCRPVISGYSSTECSETIGICGSGQRCSLAAEIERRDCDGVLRDQCLKSVKGAITVVSLDGEQIGKLI